VSSAKYFDAPALHARIRMRKNKSGDIDIAAGCLVMRSAQCLHERGDGDVPPRHRDAHTGPR
jgi:hypothetical protein